jgi:predicted nicotinamide N-methyase
LKENIKLNVDSNNSNNNPNVISVTAIDWIDQNSYVYPYDNDTKEQLPWDVIIGADIVWIEQLIEPLVTCLYHLSSQQTTILIAHQKRSEGADKLFFTMLDKYFTISAIPQQQHHPQYWNTKISILNIKRKQ